VKLLLTSSGIANPSINEALVDLLGKPVGDSNALFVPTGMHPFPGHSANLISTIRGQATSPFTELGWKSLGLLELTALPTIKREDWIATLRETDALLVWGGHVMYLNYWMRQSGVADVLPMLENLVYVGVSAGSIVMTPYSCDVEWNLEHVPDDGVVARAHPGTLGLVDFTMWVHVDNPNPIFDEHTMDNVERWARGVPVPTYAIDDQTAIKVDGDDVEVISEGNWRLFTP